LPAELLVQNSTLVHSSMVITYSEISKYPHNTALSTDSVVNMLTGH